MATVNDGRARYESGGAEEKPRKRPFRPGSTLFLSIKTIINIWGLFGCSVDANCYGYRKVL